MSSLLKGILTQMPVDKLAQNIIESKCISDTEELIKALQEYVDAFDSKLDFDMMRSENGLS